jgi:hypothetical protein
MATNDKAAAAATGRTPLVDGQVAALFKVGFIQPIDVAFLLLGGLATLIFGVWCLAKGGIGLQSYVVYFSLINFFGVMWTIILGYRACWFALNTRANLELLPEQAAALLHNYLQQGVSDAKQTTTNP